MSSDITYLVKLERCGGVWLFDAMYVAVCYGWIADRPLTGD